MEEVVLSGAYATFGLYDRPGDDVVERAGELMADMGLAGLSSQNFADLSAGEKQRVLLARGRLARPDLLILDEPCAGLDLAAREKFLGLVEAMASDPGGPTLLMVTHRAVEITPGFTHALLLHRGRVLGAGPMDRVLTDELFSGPWRLNAGSCAVRVGTGWRRFRKQADRGLDHGGQKEQGSGPGHDAGKGVSAPPFQRSIPRRAWTANQATKKIHPIDGRPCRI